MEEDIQSKLIELSRHVQEIGRQIADNKSKVEDLEALSRKLMMDQQALNLYIDILKHQYEE